MGILLLAIVLAICFTIIDVVATILEGKLSTVDGINPYWKLSLVFKCLTDAIMLDDFATELKRIGTDQRLPRHIRRNKLQDDYQPDGHTSPTLQARPLNYPAPTKGRTTGGGNVNEIEDVGGLSR